MGSGVDAGSEVFDPVTNTFAALKTPSFQYLPQVAGVQFASGLVLFTGDNDGNSAGTTFAALYDPNSGLVTLTGNMNSPRADQTMVLLPDGTVLVEGGWGDSLAEIFDPATGKFTQTGATDIFGPLGAALLDGTALIAGNLGFIYHPNNPYHVGAVQPFRKRYWARRHLESGDRAACFRAKSSGGR